MNRCQRLGVLRPIETILSAVLEGSMLQLFPGPVAVRSLKVENLSILLPRFHPRGLDESVSANPNQ